MTADEEKIDLSFTGWVKEVWEITNLKEKIAIAVYLLLIIAAVGFILFCAWRLMLKVPEFVMRFLK